MANSEDVLRAIGKLEGKIDGIDDKLDSHSGRLNNHSGRIRTVENRQHWYAGAAALFVAAASFIWNNIGSRP